MHAYDAVGAGMESVTIAPLMVNESGCAPVQAPPQSDAPGLWSTFARACASGAGGTCGSTGETCSPAAPDGFRQCVFFLPGEYDCPSSTFSPYTEKHVFYGSADDTRQCSPCACTSAPGSCSAVLSVYGDGACGDKPLDTISFTSSMPLCFGVPGSALGSKSIGPATYAPGACQPTGGESTGSIVPLMPATFCCIPSP